MFPSQPNGIRQWSSKQKALRVVLKHRCVCVCVRVSKLKVWTKRENVKPVSNMGCTFRKLCSSKHGRGFPKNSKFPKHRAETRERFPKQSDVSLPCKLARTKVVRFPFRSHVCFWNGLKQPLRPCDVPCMDRVSNGPEKAIRFGGV